MFTNEPFIDLTVAENREKFAAVLKKIDQQIVKGSYAAYPIIEGRDVKTSEIKDSLDPSESSIVVGKLHQAGAAEADRALQVLLKGKDRWRRTPATRRAEIIRNAGQLMRQERWELAALIVREAGKAWKEADADVCEAIDFCDYYADEMIRLGQPQLTQKVSGETNLYLYKPRGIALVIAPWNFPLAIACGMATAALVTGNCTILKPSEQTTLIAYRFAKILHEAGVPEDAFAFLPGKGSVIGRKLVDSPDVEMICFTGSREVGQEILSKTAEIKPGQASIKRAILELGGKNAIIVDEDADLDEAIKGVIYSAFGYSGQKCSACSRVIVVGDAYETFVSRLVDAAEDIITGKTSDPATLVGPVIDAASQRRILETIEKGERELKLAFKGRVPTNGFYVPVTIFRDVPTTSEIWREEIFGPVLACRSAETFPEAIKMANDSSYALTGGVFSRSPSNIAYASEEFLVGNLYINRGCTGALVCRQPFGGFKMSGVGSKAGGPDYLLQFMEPRTISENTMRRGFAPD